jgi:hypothetical protein
MLRFVKKNGTSVDSVAPGCTQPPGSADDIPAGTFKQNWRGEKMDLDLALDAMPRKKRDVPAGTSTDRPQ